ncbi:MAG: hypothetical protein LBF74_07425 [Treponema sp.]|jgi:hypothetical protein|nr:hypothetical protein [Treponema sp.]
MNILKFQIKSREYTVEYETVSDIVRIKCGDTPRNELSDTINLLVKSADILFGFSVGSAKFSSLSISHGDNSKSRLTLELPVMGNDPAKLQYPAVNRSVMLDANGEYLEKDPRNVYNRCLQAAEKSIKDYVRGKRQQMSLEFQADANDELAEALGVDDPDIKRITNFQRRKAKEAVASDNVLSFGN